MENLLFDNNIKVTVSQSPTDPTMGDDVTFTANVFFSRPSDEYGVPNTYFFSYTWLVSNDGGNNFYQVGSDLEELVIYSVDQTFFNNIYKVQVALIDLNNIILTEDGNNLTTQFGEILLGNTSTSSLSIQTATNNSSVTNISPISSNLNIESLDVLNLDSVIGEAAVFDTTITPETSAEVLSGQITLDKFGNSQTITGTPLILTPTEELPDPIIETELNQQNILSGTKFFTKEMQLSAPCDTQLSYDVCIPASNGPYNNLEECLDSGACTNDDMITIKKYDLSKNVLGDSIGYACNYLMGPAPQGGVYLTEQIKRYCCTGNLIELCPLEVKSGFATCDGDDQEKYMPSMPSTKCKESFRQISRVKEIGLTVNPLAKTGDCGCNPPNATFMDIDFTGKIISQNGDDIEIETEADTFDILVEQQ